MTPKRPPRLRGPQFFAIAGTFALPVLAGCAYDDGYYDPTPGYGHYGNPCWPYGCDDWRHDRHHRHGWGDGDGDGDNSHHHGNGDANGGRPPGGPTDHAGGSPDRQTQGGIRERSGDTIWILPQRDSKR